MSKDEPNPFDFNQLKQNEESAILYRLDERTERMDRRIERIDGRVQSQEDTLSEHDDRIQRNTSILNAITFSVGSFVTGVIGKLSGVIKF